VTKGIKLTLVTMQIQSQNEEISGRFNKEDRNRAWNSIIHENTKSLWEAVRVLPNILYENKQEIPANSLTYMFAKLFEGKIKNLLIQVTIDKYACNITNKIVPKSKMITTRIQECMKTLK
jgi:hypothetical protein